ncbi:hypothetical protein [Thermoanaerobacterium sp. R66]|nr:hypothetical protein [Thermoanaerobacterium sp. R66]
MIKHFNFEIAVYCLKAVYDVKYKIVMELKITVKKNYELDWRSYE